MIVQLSPNTRLASTGKLLASISLNKLLADTDERGNPVGVAVDIATEIARQWNVELEILPCYSAADAVRAVETEQANMGFFAVDRDRNKSIHFSTPYLFLQGSFVVRNDSDIRSIVQVDQTGHRIAAVRGTAYELHLRRILKSATIVHHPNSYSVIEDLLRGNVDISAGIRTVLLTESIAHPDLQILPGKFMIIPQAIGLPKNCPHSVSAAVNTFIRKMVSEGFIEASLDRHQIKGCAIAHRAAVGRKMLTLD